MEFKSLLDAVQTIGTGKLYTVTIEHWNATCGTNVVIGIYDNREEAESEAKRIYGGYTGSNAVEFKTIVNEYEIDEYGEIDWNGGNEITAFGYEEARA